MEATGTQVAAGWRRAAALYAGVVAVALVAAIGEAGAVLLVAPPVAVAAAPLLWSGSGRARASAVAAALLGVWSLLGATLLGLWFLPAAVLLGVAAMRERP